MKIQDLNGKNVCILGFGREGKAMAKALQEHAPDAAITIADRNEKIDIPHSTFDIQIGEHYLKDLNRFDCIIKSPGIPLTKELATNHYPLTTSTQIFFDTIKDSGATVIGVTGSKGKSTTGSLIHAILTANGKKSFLIGNIGEPAINYLNSAKPNTFFVQEMSSYQLMDLTVSPSLVVITSFFPEHLDYHGSLESYLEAKKHITRFQTKEDVVFFNAHYPEAKEIANESRGTKISFGPEDSPLALADIRLKGGHNLGNIAGAFKVAMYLKLNEEKTLSAIKEFQGLPHRLQSLGIHDGVEWINDSISTTPESAIAAMDALGENVAVMILGGQDRGYDFAPLAKRIKSSSVQNVILLPESGGTIKKLIEKETKEVGCTEVSSMQEAVRLAKEKTKGSSSIVLLSPASPSYGHFKDFEDRGEQFRRAIEE